MKKGLIKTCIFEYICKNGLNTPQQVMDKLPDIYKYLKKHPVHKDLLPEDVTLDIFRRKAQEGLEMAIVMSQVGGFNIRF